MKILENLTEGISGLLVREGNVANATVIAAPATTKNDFGKQAFSNALHFIRAINDISD
jgi:hypothetical protein